ncbi:Wall-associated receptor kinase galacturonan-binding domain-containing protein [Cynara cardunculus var. scolymus]|uniref:Wall-associated receptor kinase galacturonan-binding domain-containing protein n=1 Tax=Cynara cardunculus var. scolymus TaxID=59895 RepID=A0A118IDY3_CYNCS|nr:Wall-associated receptor kinase galacturonan-binding domain-containing protein [Cynara cardunculus var. scolymus]
MNYSKAGCEDTCGNVTIPYPFGIGAKCSINEWFVVDCNSSTPYLPALNHLEVLAVNLENQTVTLYVPTIYDCQNQLLNRSHISSIILGSSPFLISKSQKKFVVEGCANAFISDDKGSVVAGCSNSCRNDTVSEGNNCYGIKCCTATLPHHLKSYSMNLTGLGGEGACGSAFLVDENSYVEGSFLGQSIASDNCSVPLSLLWMLTDSDDLHQSSCCDPGGDRISSPVDLGNGTSVDSRICYKYRNYEGNPYLPFGCNGT